MQDMFFNCYMDTMWVYDEFEGVDRENKLNAILELVHDEYLEDEILKLLKEKYEEKKSMNKFNDIKEKYHLTDDLQVDIDYIKDYVFENR